MTNNNPIKHTGVIERIDENTLTIRIQQVAACAACAAQRICGSADKKEKYIEEIGRAHV